VATRKVGVFSWVTQEDYGVSELLTSGDVELFTLMEEPPAVSPLPSGTAPPVTQFTLRGVKGTISLTPIDFFGTLTGAPMIGFAGIYLASWDVVNDSYMLLDPSDPSEITGRDWLWHHSMTLVPSEYNPPNPDILTPAQDLTVNFECNVRVGVGEAIVLVVQFAGGYDPVLWVTPCLRLRVAHID